MEGAAYIGCHTLVLGRVVAAFARENFSFIRERLPERLMASAPIEELKTVATEAERSQIENVSGILWTALAVEEGPRGRGTGTLLSKGEQEEEGREGRGGRGAGGRGECGAGYIEQREQ